MLDLGLFRVRNFAVTNLETLIVYSGLIGAFFFVTLFLQQTVGYSPLAAGFATTPISLILFVLSPVFGRIATSTGPRVPMCVGPIVGGIGLLLLMRVDSNASYVTDVLPGVIVFGLGLSATVAPLTATALNSVAENRVGVASGINNAVSRIAGVLAIAVFGALIAGKFGSTVDSKLADSSLSPQADRAISKAKDNPLQPPSTERTAARSGRGGGERHRRGRRGRLPSGDDDGGHADDRRRSDRRDRAAQSAARDGLRRAARGRPPANAPIVPTTSTGRRLASRSASPWPSRRRLSPWPSSIPRRAKLIESDRLAHMVTLNPDGSPQVTCIWVGLDGDEIVSGHLPRNQKVKNVERDGRVAISIEGEPAQRDGPAGVPRRPRDTPGSSRAAPPSCCSGSRTSTSAPT